jgi:predicted GNAT family acetyltransferase
MDNYTAIHKPDVHRFEIHKDGHTGFVEYSIHDGYLDILHTIVDPRLENLGIGSALVRAAYDWGKTQNLKPMGSCQFAYIWLRRHPEYN